MITYIIHVQYNHKNAHYMYMYIHPNYVFWFKKKPLAPWKINIPPQEA